MASRRGSIRFNVAEAKARFAELVRKAMSGEEVIIARDNKPLLKLVPLEPPRKSSKARFGERPGLDGSRLRRDAEGFRQLRLMRLLLDTHTFLWCRGRD
jgi:prevent-host-death family protein